MVMSEDDKKVIARLKAMTLEQARIELASGAFGKPGRPDHDFASRWLAIKEAEARDAREVEILSIAKEASSVAREANLLAHEASSTARKTDSFTRRAVLKDRIIAIIAIIIAAIAAREHIIWFISWLVSIIKTP